MRRTRSPEEKLAVGRELQRVRKALKLSQAQVAKEMGLQSQSVVSNWENGVLESWQEMLPRLSELYALDLAELRALAEGERDTLSARPIVQPDHPSRVVSRVAQDDFDGGALESYVAIEVLPTYAGLGGGGTGDGDRKTTLLPRSLVEDDLRSRADDLLVIDLRGDSMEPDFLNGDRVVINRRDVNPVQPGPFALWDGDGYVVKNVERRRGSLRIFSSNPKYSDWESDGSDIQIMGRPVWVARRL